MQTTTDFLDAVKKRLSLPSDYAVAGALGLKRQSLSHYRKKRDFLGEETACRVAQILELSPGYVLACVAAERAKAAGVRRAWEKAARALQHTAAAVILGFFALSGVAPAPAHAAAGPDICILCKKRRWRWIVAVLALFTVPAAEASETLSRQDIALEAVYQLTAAADWGQTRWMTQHWHWAEPGPRGSLHPKERHEINPLLGDHPSIGRVNAYFLACGITHALITAALPARWRPYWQGAGIVLEVSFVAHNAALGVHFDF